MAQEYELTELQYSNERKGPFRLYIYGHDGQHSGAYYAIRKGQRPTSGREITKQQMMELALAGAAAGVEIRITDMGDMLVYHCKGSKVLYPKPIGDFWKEITEA